MKYQHDTTEEIRPSIKEMNQWRLTLEQLHQRIAPRFARPEPRHHALLYLKAILSEIPRKNGWQIAEHAHQRRPYGMQRLLSKAVCDVDGIRDDVRAYVLEQLGTSSGSLRILVPDESGIRQQRQKVSRSQKTTLWGDWAKRELPGGSHVDLCHRTRTCLH